LISTSEAVRYEAARGAAAPVVVVSARAALRVRQGHPLVARLEVTTPPVEPAEVVWLVERRGAREQLLASALWCPRGPIAARVLAREPVALDRALLRQRIAAADARRQALFAGAQPPRSAYRVVHGEADLLPGLFVDRYGDAAVLQTATAAMDAHEAEIAEVLAETLGVTTVVCRDDGSARDLEELPRKKGILRGGAAARGTRAGQGGAAGSLMVRFEDAGSPMVADLLADRKTGSFLDQQENHACAAEYARRLHPGGSALDAFCYHGGFALALARAGLSVLACDEDPQAIGRARHNAQLGAVQVDFRVANAFDLLRSLEAGGRRFDVVVLDPPALAKRGVKGPGGPSGAAMRAYKELNLRALRLLGPGGLLVSCSCSGRVSAADFGGMLDDAARDVGRPLQILERRGAGRDHPGLCGMAESEYLKCWLLRAVD
jgi:23S rRNA (cytosine1962-C5)-methyltransferase